MGATPWRFKSSHPHSQIPGVECALRAQAPARDPKGVVRRHPLELKRNRVCVLHAGGVNLPSDIDGLAYVPLDESGAWKFELGHELKSAGYSVDLNELRL